jgi:hypothetical protein
MREEQRSILLFDEPGIHLHLQGQRDLLRMIREDISKHHQVIFSTHLPGMIDVAALDSIRGVTKYHKSTPATHITGDEDHESQMPVFEVLEEALGSRGLGPYGTGRTLVVEGITDWLYLITMAGLKDGDSVISPDILNGIVLIKPALGASKIPTKTLPQLMVPGTGCAIIVDKDQGGKKAAREVADLYSPPNPPLNEVMFISAGMTKSEIKDENADFAVEDLFGPSFFTTIVNEGLSNELADGDKFTAPGPQDGRMLGDAVVDWMKQRDLSPKSEKVVIAKRFREMVSTGQIEVPTTVRRRFRRLLKKAVDATQPRDLAKE